MVSSFAEEERDLSIDEDLGGRDSPSRHEEVIQFKTSNEKGYDFSKVAKETQVGICF